jgi:hypothetical protein
MRPAGEIRDALRRHGCFPPPEAGSATWRDALAELGRLKIVNPQAPSERKLVRQAVENMVQAGEIQKAEPKRVAGSRRPMMGYSATDWRGGSSHSGASLVQVLAAWR